MPDIYSLLSMIKKGRKDILPHLVNNSKFESIFGGKTEWVIGGGSTSNIYSSNSTTVTNYGELLKYVMGSGPGASGLTKFLYFPLNIFLAGGERSYVLGNREEMTYRLTPNFKVDRFHKVKGLGSLNIDTGKVSDFDYTPADLNKDPDIFSRTNNNTMFLCFAFLQTLNLLIGLATVEFYNHGDRILGGSDSENSIGGTDLSEADDDNFYKLATDFRTFSGLAYGMLMGIFKTFGEQPSYAAYKSKKDLEHLKNEIANAWREFNNSHTALTDELAVATTNWDQALMAGNFEQAANINRQCESIQSKIHKLEDSFNETLTILTGI
ncbi:MAG: hypothetical protein EBS30_05280 [Planctomycetes bacterium]|nr:hypothetical protein [Planctomycetota bacterium]